MEKRKVLVCLLVSIFSIFLTFNLVSAERMNFGINAELNEFSTNFYIEDEPEADVGLNGFDVELPDYPSEPYSEFYSVIDDNGEKELVLDSWNASGEYSTRTLDLVYYASSDYTGSLNLSWDNNELGERYYATLTDYGGDSSRSLKNKVASISLNSNSEYRADNSEQKRYFELKVTRYYCGDEIVNSSLNEECDSDNLDGETCTSLGHPDGEEGLSCSSSCEYDVSGCYECGDGTITPIAGEECDCGNPWDCYSDDGDDNLDGESCESLGYDSGTLSCSQVDCGFNTSQCEYEEKEEDTGGGSGGGGSPGMAEGQEDLECEDECSPENPNSVCVNSSAYKVRECEDFDGDGCYEDGNWTYNKCEKEEICYNGECIPRDVEDKQEITCERLGYECGEHSVYGGNINCGYCSLGESCSDEGKCVLSEDYGLSFYDKFMGFFDLRKLFWRIVKKVVYKNNLLFLEDSGNFYKLNGVLLLK